MKLKAPTRRLHIAVTDSQYETLADEAALTGLPIAELIRRAIERTYGPRARRALGGLVLHVGIWLRPDAAIVGRVRTWVSRFRSRRRD
jgi:hypothetical protein